MKKISVLPEREARQLDPMILEVPEEGEEIQVETRGGSKTVVVWVNGRAKERMVR